MTLTQIAKKARSEYTKLTGEEKRLKSELIKTLEIHINIGELLKSAKTKCEDEGIGFIDWVEETQVFSDRQSRKYIRIATHKEQARLTFIENDKAVTIDKLQEVLPKTSEPIEVTSADINKLGYVGTKPSKKARNADDWHTPTIYIDAAREVMGTIDLDPFSSYQANERVQATEIYTEADDALTLDWKEVNTIWMNPPYAAGLSNKAVDKFLAERFKFNHAIVLMNASSDTKWFEKMRLQASSVCLTNFRIAFEDAGGKKQSGNTKGQVFFYFGENTSAFCRVFKTYGWVVPGGECQDV